LARIRENLSPGAEREKVGILCPYTPEELIDAAGFVPTRVIPENPAVDIVDAYLPNNFCTFLRSTVDMGLKGGFGDFQCLVINHSCDGARRAFDVFRHYVGGLVTYFLDVPKKSDSISIKYYTHQLEDFSEFLQQISGSRITTEAFSASIKRYGENRRLLRKLYDLRAHYQEKLPSRFMVDLLNMNARNPKETMNPVLQRIIEETCSKTVPSPRKRNVKRLYVSGNLIDALPFLEMIEQAGGRVVGDDFCFGGRYSSGEIEGVCESLQALAKMHLSRIPCGRMVDCERRFDFILQGIRQYSADGLVYISLKFCDNFLSDFPMLKQILDREHIPSLFIETEYFPLGRGQIQTRIEGFLEML
jgi:benzoyl-CoA reductase/2-hydroxyglutaryl-CoA dehydratase subunit BcrC/BadD/HgdB